MNTTEPIHTSNEKTYLCEYSYGGDRWSFEIKANSHEEAERKLKRISYGKVLGELEAVIPYDFGWMARVWVWASEFLKK